MYSNNVNKNNGLTVLNGTLCAMFNLILKKNLMRLDKVYLFKHQTLAGGHTGVMPYITKGKN